MGNADTTLVKLDTKKTILFDFANYKVGEDDNDKRCSLKEELDKDNSKDHFDIVCFTHIDQDHVVGAKDYFYFEHSSTYQSSDRKKIKELWVLNWLHLFLQIFL